GSQVGVSLTLYLVLYAVLLLAYLQTLFYMARNSVEVEEFEREAHVDLDELEARAAAESDAAHEEAR
ncbi:MAG: hypothetical protein WD668_05445, partial [Saccharospirillum sp.]